MLCVLTYLIKTKHEYLYGVPRVVVPPSVILLAFSAVMSGIFLFSSGLGVSKICVESKFEAYSRARCSGVVMHTSAIPL